MVLYGWGLDDNCIQFGRCQEEQVCRSKIGGIFLPVTLEVDGYAHMDSAQVFFFRKFPDRDSLVFRQMVYDLGMQPRQIDFTLPLGVYDVLILGNVRDGPDF